MLLKFSKSAKPCVSIHNCLVQSRHGENDIDSQMAAVTKKVWGSKRFFAEMGYALVIPWPSGKCHKCGKDVRWGESLYELWRNTLCLARWLVPKLA